MTSRRILEPARREPPTCSECCRDVGGQVVRINDDGSLTCAYCDPSIEEEFVE